MDFSFSQITDHLWDRVSGPLHLRLVINPLVASALAIIDGIRDGRSGRPPYLWSLVMQPDRRRALLKHGCLRIGRVLAVAVLLDGVFQYMTLGQVRPLAALIVGLELAVLPYLIVRGPVARIVRMRRRFAGTGRRGQGRRRA